MKMIIYSDKLFNYIKLIRNASLVAGDFYIATKDKEKNNKAKDKNERQAKINNMVKDMYPELYNLQVEKNKNPEIK